MTKDFRRPAWQKANTPVATYDAVIIGTGQAGPPLARRLAAAGMTVAVIEYSYPQAREVRLGWAVSMGQVGRRAGRLKSLRPPRFPSGSGALSIGRRSGHQRRGCGQNGGRQRSAG